MTVPARPTVRPRLLSELGRAAGLPMHGGDVLIRDMSIDSRKVQPGELFVAVPGTIQDGHRYIPDAIRNGAAAICATIPVPDIPTLVAESPGAALADLAAALLEHPTADVSVIGVTGSLGKTSTALLVQACLTGGGLRAGVIGSLGVRARGTIHETGLTTPDALTLQRELRWMAGEGVGMVIAEVSSHGLLLERVRGLELALGIFTNLVPDEHLEFHPTPEHYVRTKLRFLDLLRPGAPLVYNADDSLVASAAGSRSADRAVGVSRDGRDSAAVHVRDSHLHVGGGDFSLVIRRELVTLNGAVVATGEHRLHVPLLGQQQIDNAALAATAAILAGVPAGDVARGLAATAPIRRRTEVVRAASPLVMDDTAGNPRSIHEVQRLVATLGIRSPRIVYAIRGSRGSTINAHCANALADLAQATGAVLTVTSSTDAADERNSVTGEELEAAVAALRDRHVQFHYEPELSDAIAHGLDGVQASDVLLLLGAQGMDDGATMARELLDGDGELAGIDQAAP